MHYFSYITHNTLPKNKLEKAILTYLRINEREIVKEADVVMFKNHVLADIAQLAAEFFRCKTVNLKYVSFRLRDNKDYYLEGLDFVSYNLFKSNN